MKEHVNLDSSSRIQHATSSSAGVYNQTTNDIIKHIQLISCPNVRINQLTVIIPLIFITLFLTLIKSIWLMTMMMPITFKTIFWRIL